MDSLPTNYNPNESLLNGGTDSAIMKVMGGGGALNGYNETQSLLNGGLDAVIEKIEGGATSNTVGQETDSAPQTSITADTIEFINYKTINTNDQKEFNSLKTIITNYTTISALITRLKTVAITKSNKAIFSYKKNGDLLEKTSPGRETNETQIIRFIPSTAEYIVVSPSISDPFDFFLLVKFLIMGDLCIIDKKNNYILKKGVYVIFLNLNFETTNKDHEILEYLYYKFKSTNIHQCILINEKEKAILFIEDKIVGFVSNKNDTFYKPKGTDILDITEKDLIYEYGIKAYAYTKGDYPYDTIQQIKSGEEDTEDTSNYDITLKDKVLLLKLKETDIVYNKIDIYGKYYKIRVPKFRDQTDSVFKAWTNKKWSTDEDKLIKDLKLEKLLDTSEQIPTFLYYLSYYKCFDDISLLTKQECKEMRSYLEQIYKKIIENITTQ